MHISIIKAMKTWAWPYLQEKSQRLLAFTATHCSTTRQRCGIQPNLLQYKSLVNWHPHVSIHNWSWYLTGLPPIRPPSQFLQSLSPNRMFTFFSTNPSCTPEFPSLSESSSSSLQLWSSSLFNLSSSCILVKATPPCKLLTSNQLLEKWSYEPSVNWVDASEIKSLWHRRIRMCVSLIFLAINNKIWNNLKQFNILWSQWVLEISRKMAVIVTH